MPLGEDIDALLEPLIASFSGSLLEELEGELVSVYVAGDAQMVAWAKQPFEGPPAKAAVDFAKKRGATLVKGLDEETLERLRTTIANGIQNKRGVPGLARDIRQTFADMTRHRSELIARTETANALGEAFMDRGKALGITGKEWVDAGDDRVSPECLDNSAAGAIPIGETFPAGPMHPPQHPGCRCLPPGMIIEANDIQRVYRRWYEGDLVEITTALGNKFSATPNHPVLTDGGWVGLGLLEEGDYVICALGTEGVFGIDPDIDYIPTTIGEIFQAFSIVGCTERVIGAPMDFHGDGRQEQIDIVTVDDALSYRRQTAISKHLEHCRFAPTHGEMGLASSYRPLGGIKESQSIGLATIAAGDISGLQSGGDDIPVNTKPLCQTKLRVPVEVAPDNQTIIESILVPSGCCRLLTADDPTILRGAQEPPFSQDSSQSLIPNMVAPRNGFDAVARGVVSDRVVNISRTRFAHYVYNLQTMSGRYRANSIITHNCATAPVML